MVLLDLVIVGIVNRREADSPSDIRWRANGTTQLREVIPSSYLLEMASKERKGRGVHLKDFTIIHGIEPCE